MSPGECVFPGRKPPYGQEKNLARPSGPFRLRRSRNSDTRDAARMALRPVSPETVSHLRGSRCLSRGQLGEGGGERRDRKEGAEGRERRGREGERKGGKERRERREEQREDDKLSSRPGRSETARERSRTAPRLRKTVSRNSKTVHPRRPRSAPVRPTDPQSAKRAAPAMSSSQQPRAAETSSGSRQQQQLAGNISKPH